MNRSTFVMHLFVCLAAVAATCTPAGRLPAGFPEPSASGTRLDTSERGSWKSPVVPRQPLSVIHASPDGKSTYDESSPVIVVAFNQPMVRLGPDRKSAAARRKLPFAIHPQAKGQFRWATADTLRIEVDGLAAATRYRVTVPTTLTSLSGSRLKRPHTWTFETPRPKVWSVKLLPDDATRAGRMLPRDTIEIRFDRDVTLASVRQTLKVQVEGKPWPVTVTRNPEGKEKNEFHVRSAHPYPPGREGGADGAKGGALHRGAAARRPALCNALGRARARRRHAALW